MKLLFVKRTNKFPGLTTSFSVFEMSDDDLSYYPKNWLLRYIDVEKYKFYPKRYFAAPSELREEKLEEISRDPQAAINYAFLLMSCCGATYFTDHEKYRFTAFGDTPKEALRKSKRLVEKIYNIDFKKSEDEKKEEE